MIKELPKLESYLKSIGYKMSDIKRINPTAHADHAQAANEIKKRTSGASSDGQAEICSLDRRF